MKKIFSASVIILIIMVFISSCKKDNTNNNSDALINPADANALTRVVVMPAGASRITGSVPAPTSGPQTPGINALYVNLITSNGSTAPFLYSYSNVSNNLGGCYVQILGASSYFNVPYTATATSSGQLNLPVVLPANVDSGSFCLLFSVYDLSGNVSKQVSVCASVLRLGTGSLQVSLSWNTPTDQDLWITDPSGTKIFYANKTSSTGGQLDRDDRDGYGPENIYWLSNAPDGDYVVQVNDYEGTFTPNTCYVTINAPGKSKSFTVTTQNNSTVNVATIKKNGGSYVF